MIGSALKGLFAKPYTIGDLMTVDPERQQKSFGCKVSLEETFFTLEDESIPTKIKNFFIGNTIKKLFITLKLKVVGDTGNTHYVYIELDPDFSMKNWTDNRVRIYCDCNDFKFRSAYNLNRRGSLFDNQYTKIGLGQALSEAPKRGGSILCKHGFAALNWLMSNYSYIMSTL